MLRLKTNICIVLVHVSDSFPDHRQQSGHLHLFSLSMRLNFSLTHTVVIWRSNLDQMPGFLVLPFDFYGVVEGKWEREMVRKI